MPFDFVYFGKEFLKTPSPQINHLEKAHKVAYKCLVDTKHGGYWVVNDDENPEIDTSLVEKCKAMNVVKNKLLSILSITSLVRFIRQRLIATLATARKEIFVTQVVKDFSKYTEEYSKNTDDYDNRFMDISKKLIKLIAVMMDFVSCGLDHAH